MRELCPRCARPEAQCYCALVERLETRTRVVFLQHPRERDVAIGTVRIARLCLPSSELCVGIDFTRDPIASAALAAPNAALLFPGPDARDIRADPPAGPVTLIVLDGTWWQAAKLLKSNPALRALPQYRLEPSHASRYRIRKEPEEHCVATIEALVEVLGVLEGDPERMARMLAPFDAMVETQLAFAREGHARSRHVHRKRAPRKRPVPSVLRERPGDVVLAYGEANAWPYGMEGAPPPEIVHWTALRPATGERFEAFVAPRHALAPSFMHHARLGIERVASGEPREAFRARWAQFLRADDVLCSWGWYATEVLASEGAALPPRLDLRRAAIEHMGRRVGALAECAAAMGVEVEAPLGEGRAGVRLAEIAAIARALARPS